MSAEQPWLDDAEAGSAPWDRDMEVGALDRSVPNAPHGIVNAIISGLESSASGLTYRGELPSQTLPQDSTWGERAAAGIAGIIADLPYSVAGVVGAGAAGTAAAGPVGGALGAAGGAVGAPMAVREALMVAYAQGGVHSWSDAWEVTKASVEGLGKGGLIGMATAGAGRAATAAGAGTVQRTAVEIAALTSAGAALEGRLPTFQDITDAAIVVGGIHGAVKITQGLSNIYARTGVKPADVALDAVNDLSIKKDLLADPTQIPKTYQARALEERIKASVTEVQDRVTAVRFTENPFAEIGQKEGERLRPGYFNYKYIDGPAELHGAIERMSQLYQAKIQTATRGTVAQTQTLAEAAKLRLADTLGIAPDKLPPELNVPASHLAARYTAKRMAAIDITQELKARGQELAKLGANATEAQITEYMAFTEKASMVAADTLGMRAEVARAQAAGKIKLGAEINLEAMQKLIDSHGGRDKIMAFARVMGDADNPTSVLRAAQAMVKPTVFEKGVEIWKASILSGPTTHLANLFGNTVSTIMKFPERLTAAAIGKLHGGEKVTVAEVRALASGMGQGSLDALKLAGQAASDAIRLKETLPDASKTEQYRNAVGGKVGEAVRIPFKLLTAGDLLFRTLNERGEAHALAVRQAIKEDFAPGTREFGARVVDLVQNPTEAMTKAIVAAGDKATFTTKLGHRGTHLQMVVKGSPAEFMLPFIKTPVNLLKWAAEYTPGVNLLMESVRADLSGKNGAAARDIAVARMIVGSAVATVVIEAVDAGTITGGGLADPEKRRAKVAAGWQPYSIKIGDAYYSYQRVDPLARVMSAAADASELYHVAGDNDKLNLAGAVTAAIGNATISQTYLSGLANAINAVTDPNRYAGRWLDQYAASLVPGLLGQTAAAIDPQAREVNSMMDAMQARIPILREQLLPKRNPLTGEPIAGTERVAPFAPVTVTEESKDKVLTEAARLGVRLPIAPREVTVAGKVGKLGKVEISPEARNAFTEKQGTFAHEILSQIVNAPSWDGIPDMIKLDIYGKIMTAARTQAALAALPPEARGAEVMRIADEISSKLGVAK